jgi:serine/threonine protein kinase
MGVKEGDVIAGKYRVDKVLGAGGMGVVVAGRHVQLDTRVAIKLLLPELLSNQEAVGRFAREARAAVRITSEHVARVLDVGTLESGAPYMVMEYLDGGDLAGWLRSRGPLPVEQAVDFVLQACVAVADAHALGIVHRDLKPANLFCVRRSDGQLTIKVIDFGISKVTDFVTLSGSGSGSGTAMSVTRTVAVMGSPLYMSPEQMQSPRDVDALTDIWALGVVLFELLTGKVPFSGETFGEIAVKVATQAAPPMRALRADMPPGLEGVIRRCLQADRTRRHRNVAELALALMPFAPDRARASVDRISGILQVAGARSLPPAVAATPYTPESIAPVGRSAPGVTPRGRAALAGVLGTMTAVGVVAGLALMTQRGPPARDGGTAASPTPQAVETSAPLASGGLAPLLPSVPSEASPLAARGEGARKAPASTLPDAAAPAKPEPTVPAAASAPAPARRQAAGYKDMPY